MWLRYFLTENFSRSLCFIWFELLKECRVWVGDVFFCVRTVCETSQLSELRLVIYTSMQCMFRISECIMDLFKFKLRLLWILWYLIKVTVLQYTILQHFLLTTSVHHSAVLSHDHTWSSTDFIDNYFTLSVDSVYW